MQPLQHEYPIVVIWNIGKQSKKKQYNNNYMIIIYSCNVTDECYKGIVEIKNGIGNTIMGIRQISYFTGYEAVIIIIIILIIIIIKSFNYY